MLEITENTFIHSILVCKFPKGDVFAYITREGPDGEWKYEYRFRHYKDDKAWGSADERNVYTIKGIKSPEEFLADLERTLRQSYSIIYGGQPEIHVYPVMGGVEKFYALTKQHPEYFHVKPAGGA
jgi:hypothetical protein